MSVRYSLQLYCLACSAFIFVGEMWEVFASVFGHVLNSVDPDQTASREIV